MRAVVHLLSALAIASCLAACADVLGIQPGKTDPSACQRNSECAPRELCVEHVCVASCKQSSDCAEGRVCKDQLCELDDRHCLANTRRCNGLQPESCGPLGTWQADGDACPMACSSGTCRRPPSCDDALGCMGGDVSCCTSDAIDGGTFDLPFKVMGTQDKISVTVAPFTMDRFEVTTNRFYNFVLAYDAAGKPKQGAGAQPGVVGSGWNSDWNKDAMFMPPTANSLEAGTSACGSWSDPSQALWPMRCVNWYVASAFCIWDGGRLPSEAEWTFAAMGGDEQRPYPWSKAPYDAAIDRKHACYSDKDYPCPQPDPVGSYPDGAGRWNTEDLAGNVFEWVADGYRDDLKQPACPADGSTPPDAGAAADGDEAFCSDPSGGTLRAVKGGSYAHIANILLNAARSSEYADRHSVLVGFRCVRDPR